MLADANESSWGVVHAAPRRAIGLLPCCGRAPNDLPDPIRLSADPHLVTCTHPPADVERRELANRPLRLAFDAVGASADLSNTAQLTVAREVLARLAADGWLRASPERATRLREAGR